MITLNDSIKIVNNYVQAVQIIVLSNSDDDDLKEVLRCIKLAEDFVCGKYSKISKNDWWIFFDALGLYDGRDDTLEELYQIAKNHC